MDKNDQSENSGRTSNEVAENIIIYKDNYITINSREIIIKNYFFPFANSKTILIDDIRKIELFNLDILSGKLRFWGLNYKCFWFHLDPLRIYKDKCLVIDLGTCLKPAITPENIDHVYEILTIKVNKLKKSTNKIENE